MVDKNGYLAGPAQIDSFARNPIHNERRWNSALESLVIKEGGAEPVNDAGATVPVNDTLGSARVTSIKKGTKHTTRGTFIIEAYAYYYVAKK